MAATLAEWTRDFAEDLWLKADETGGEDATFLRGALRLAAGARVLDAPCGAGRISVHLARAGCLVTGIDLVESFVDRARRRFNAEGRTGRFLQMDLRRMVFDEEFHAAYSWQGSFGYFSDEDNIDVMARYARALMPGGRLLVDQPNREQMLRRFKPRVLTGGIERRNRWQPRSERVESDWLVERDGVVQHNHMSIRLYTPRQMKGLFESVGLTVEAILGSREGSSHSRSARRLITVGVKEG